MVVQGEWRDSAHWREPQPLVGDLLRSQMVLCARTGTKLVSGHELHRTPYTANYSEPRQRAVMFAVGQSEPLGKQLGERA